MLYNSLTSVRWRGKESVRTLFVVVDILGVLLLPSQSALNWRVSGRERSKPTAPILVARVLRLRWV